jgi:hypothetical protein
VTTYVAVDISAVVVCQPFTIAVGKIRTELTKHIINSEIDRFTAFILNA